MRQAYDYWQDQPGSYQTDVPSTSTSVSSLPRAQRHHRCWLVHARRLAPRLSAARQYCTARAGREFAPSRAPLPFQFSVLPAPENLGSHQRQVTPSSDRSEETADFVGVRRRRQHCHNCQGKSQWKQRLPITSPSCLGNCWREPQEDECHSLALALT